MNGNSKLAVYGDREEIRELTERLKATMPGGQRLSDVEARSLAQLSIAHGLDPFNGDCWIIPGSGLMVGIKGLRKKAREMADDESGTYWTELRAVEPQKYHAADNAVVYECYLRDTVTVQAWAKSVNAMTSAGVPYKEAIEYLGPSPVAIGVGVSTPEEKSKMGIHFRARKRAEADAIKQRYGVDFGKAEFSEEEPEIIRAEFTEQPAEKKSELEILSELGFDTATEVTEPVDDIEFVAENLVADGKIDHAKHAKEIIKFRKDDCPLGLYDFVVAYVGWKAMGADSKQAAKNANAGEMPK